MASKYIIRTPTKSIKRNHHHRRHRRKSAASISVISSINKSLSTCRRRLAKLFSKLAHIATPKSSRSSKGFRSLKQDPEFGLFDFESDLIVPKRLVFDRCLLPPATSTPKRTIFLDLDETLIHSSSDPAPETYDFVVRPKIEGQIMNFYVLKRPGVDEFLEKISKKYEVVVFTAGLRPYAALVLDNLDPKGVLISHRLYRDSCREMDGRFVKDLSQTGRDLRNAVIVDDNPNSYYLQPENAIPICPFVSDGSDRELEGLGEFLQRCDLFEDMRDAVKHHLAAGYGGCGGGTDRDLIVV